MPAPPIFNRLSSPREKQGEQILQFWSKPNLIAAWPAWPRGQVLELKEQLASAMKGQEEGLPLCAPTARPRPRA